MLIYTCLHLDLQIFEIQKDEVLYQSSPFYEGICHYVNLVQTAAIHST